PQRSVCAPKGDGPFFYRRPPSGEVTRSGNGSLTSGGLFMSFLNALGQLIRLPISRQGSAPIRANHRLLTAKLNLEPLEDRLCPSGGYLLVGSYDNNSVLRYNETTGAFVDQFDPHNLANLKNPVGGVFGSDGNLYVSSGIFLKNNQKVLQYNGMTG